MLILITWKLSHISEFTRVYSPHKEYACIVFYANLSWFRFQWVCADARKMFAHANERLNILASFGGMGARELKKTPEVEMRKITIIFPEKYFSSISWELSWDYFHTNSHTCVTHLTFYLLSVRLSMEKLLHSTNSPLLSYDFITLLLIFVDEILQNY